MKEMMYMRLHFPPRFVSYLAQFLRALARKQVAFAVSQSPSRRPPHRCYICWRSRHSYRYCRCPSDDQQEKEDCAVPRKSYDIFYVLLCF